MTLHPMIVRRCLPAAWVILGLLVPLAGCGGDDPATGTAGATSGAGTADGGTSPDDKQPPPAWADSLNSAIGHLDHARFDEADKQLQAAEALLSAAADGDEKTAGSKQLAALKSQLSSAREAEVTRLAEEKARKERERRAGNANCIKFWKIRNLCRAEFPR